LSRELLNRPLARKHDDLLALVCIGLYQLNFTRIANHTAVTATVEACRQLNKPWATSLVNAVLRKFLREKTKLFEALADDPNFKYAHPEWLLTNFKGAWPEHWTALCDANNQRPPLTLRINELRLSREQYQARLDDGELAHTANSHVPTAVTLNKAMPVDEIPGFSEGLVSVQDAAAQLAAPLLAAEPGDRILDACAAPGGKTTHLLESRTDVQVVAVDNNRRRLVRIGENLRRLGPNMRQRATLVCADASRPQTWWDGVQFERIVLDAPCSASGVIRRHPDIKHRRSADDIEQMASTQAGLLKGLWPLLAPKGRLIYTTCSVLPAENALVIESFLEAQTDAEINSITARWGSDTGFGRQILPGEHNMDGFFYACLGKTA